jgi:thioredoxin-related protein
MRSLLCLFAAVAICALAGGTTGRAALDPVASARGPDVELLVYEHHDCVYCQLFRRDVLPRYQQAVATELPIRFVDIAVSGNEGPGLSRKVDMLPTAVLMLEGREIDRLVGYWGPDSFFKLLAHMRAKIG